MIKKEEETPHLCITANGRTTVIPVVVVSEWANGMSAPETKEDLLLVQDILTLWLADQLGPNRDSQRFLEWLDKIEFDEEDEPIESPEALEEFILESGCSPDDDGVTCDLNEVDYTWVFIKWRGL